MRHPDFDVCVIGAGPAGLGFAHRWIETQAPGRLLLVEAGPGALERFCTVQEMRGCRKVEPCHVVAGIGGASGLAGGKLSEYPAGRGLAVLMGDAVERELDNSISHLGPYLPLVRPNDDEQQLAAELTHYRGLNYELRHYRANKYAQTDLVSAWAQIAREIESAGAQVMTNTRAAAISRGPNGVEVTLDTGATEKTITAVSAVIATGRSGGEFVSGLTPRHPQYPQHPLDIGVRIEFPAECWPDLDAVHNDLKLHFGNARTFCTSKSGWISPYRFRDFMLLEGRTDSVERSSWSNLAITIRSELPAEEVISEMRVSLLAQGPGSTLRQPIQDYLACTPTEPHLSREPSASFSYWRWGDINALFPSAVAQQLRDAVRRFVRDVLPPAAAENAHVFGPEIDYYWATLPHRDVELGVWSAGDVTGAYRGILQANAAGRFLVSEVEEYVSTVRSAPARSITEACS